MQLHNIQPKYSKKETKRIGRGGKRGRYSGHGIKGQKSRAGARIRPGFRGGDNPIWKLFPKQRGASSKTEVKRRLFDVAHVKPAIVSLSAISSKFVAGETVSPSSLLKHGIIKSKKNGVKILGSGNLDKKLIFVKVAFSDSARGLVEKSGSVIK